MLRSKVNFMSFTGHIGYKTVFSLYPLLIVVKYSDDVVEYNFSIQLVSQKLFFYDTEQNTFCDVMYKFSFVLSLWMRNIENVTSTTVGPYHPRSFFSPFFHGESLWNQSSLSGLSFSLITLQLIFFLLDFCFSLLPFTERNNRWILCSSP